MVDVGLRMLLWVTFGLALVLLVRRPLRGLFGAGPAFTLWLLPVALALAPLAPHGLAPVAAWSLPALVVTPHVAAASHAVASIDWTRWLLVSWLAGAGAGLVRLAIQYVHLVRSARAAPKAWAHWTTRVAGLDPRRLRVHPAGPAVLWSMPRAWVLLPADFAECFDDPASRGLVLQHELTHVRRGDAWWSLAMEIASTLLWFHPLAWFARPRFRLDQELACDAASLRARPDRTSHYARALLGSVAVRPQSALIPWLAEPQLKERIAMLARTQTSALRRRAGLVAVALMLAGGLLVSGGQTPVEAATHGARASTPPTVDINYKANHPPRYPVAALRSGHQGMVIMDITVDATGKITSIAVDPEGTNAAPELQAAAVQAAAGWKFMPGREHGKPVGGTLKVPVNFALQGVDESERCKANETYVAQTRQCVKLQPVSTSR